MGNTHKPTVDSAGTVTSVREMLSSITFPKTQLAKVTIDFGSRGKEKLVTVDSLSQNKFKDIFDMQAFLAQQILIDQVECFYRFCWNKRCMLETYARGLNPFEVAISVRIVPAQAMYKLVDKELEPVNFVELTNMSDTAEGCTTFKSHLFALIDAISETPSYRESLGCERVKVHPGVFSYLKLCIQAITAWGSFKPSRNWKNEYTYNGETHQRHSLRHFTTAEGARDIAQNDMAKALVKLIYPDVDFDALTSAGSTYQEADSQETLPFESLKQAMLDAGIKVVE